MKRKFLAKVITLGLMLAVPLVVEAGTSLENNATNGSIAVGDNADASGSFNAVAIGKDAKASGQHGVAIGGSTTASGLDSIAIGGNTKAEGNDSIAIGDDTTASGKYSIAIGDDIKYTGDSATALGQQAHATGNNSVAVGIMTNVDADWNKEHNEWRKAGEQSTAIGAYSGSWGYYSTANGAFSKAEGRFSTALGYASKANDDNSTAIGAWSSANAKGSVALGVSSVANREAGAVGAYAPAGNTEATWKATGGAVSIGADAKEAIDNTAASPELTRQITHVAAGSADTDAVNVAQLRQALNDSIGDRILNVDNKINQLGNRVDKVGAGAAALAALHPMDFDPDDKWSFAAGVGNYKGQNAAAIGAFYRPDEKVMFSIGGTMGNGENMVNAGISFALDRTNHVSNSRTALAREVLDLRAQIAEMKAMMATKGLGTIEDDKMKLFPDVAENHWAYEYVGKLAADGIIEGYPSGNFSGDRMMSRYEFAAMLYRAMQKGAQLESKIVNEFAPEMARIRVDRISGKDSDRNKIERVRVNDFRDEHDHYGSKLAK